MFQIICAGRWLRTRPGSGRKLLWCDSRVCEISGMSVPEGCALAHEMIEPIGQREHGYSHYWTPHYVVMHDNVTRPRLDGHGRPVT